MTTRDQRNLRIIEMKLARVPRLEIARQFGLSRTMVDMIVRKFEEDQQLADRSSRLRQEIGQADDLDRPWPAPHFIDALGLPKMPTTALTRHFEWRGIEAVSLRMLMDLAISAEQDSRPGYLITPLLDVRMMGIKGFWSVVRQLTRWNLGMRCSQEWQSRLARLRQCWRIKGAVRCAWSKPVSPATELDG